PATALAGHRAARGVRGAVRFSRDAGGPIAAGNTTAPRATPTRPPRPRSAAPHCPLRRLRVQAVVNALGGGPAARGDGAFQVDQPQVGALRPCEDCFALAAPLTSGPFPPLAKDCCASCFTYSAAFIQNRASSGAGD